MADHATIVTDISFGDAGKGTTVDFLARQARSAVVIRHNGGCQAAHNVVTRYGQHHTFAQFGSGTLAGASTHLSRFMLVSPANMFREAKHLRELGVDNPWELLSVDAEALVITPWQRSANRLRELARGDNRHGSCGEGIGETQSDALTRPELALRVGHLRFPEILSQKLQRIRAYKLVQLKAELGTAGLNSDLARKAWEELSRDDLLDKVCDQYAIWRDRVRIVDRDYLATLADQHDTLIFEGAQGVLLDEWRGFHPYTTWSTTTPANALQLLDEIGFSGTTTRYGVLRAYMTRHGNGPFMTEDARLTAELPDMHNGTGAWMGGFRVGHLDLVAHRYAIAACEGLDALVVTGLDRMRERGNWYYADRYDLPGKSFVVRDEHGLVRDLKLGPHKDLAYQARLTELMQSCQPQYQALSMRLGTPAAQDELLGIIEGALGLPIALVSAGPTADNKRMLALKH